MWTTWWLNGEQALKLITNSNNLVRKVAKLVDNLVGYSLLSKGIFKHCYPRSLSQYRWNVMHSVNDVTTEHYMPNGWEDVNGRYRSVGVFFSKHCCSYCTIFCSMECHIQHWKPQPLPSALCSDDGCSNDLAVHSPGFASSYSHYTFHISPPLFWFLFLKQCNRFRLKSVCWKME